MQQDKTAARKVTHLEISYPEDVEPYSLLQGGFAVSPDGGTVAMIGVRAGVRRLYIRRLDQPEATELNDTAGVNSVSFSPDSKSVAYIPGTTMLTVMSLADQQRKVIASGTDLGSGVRWTSIGILFTREGALWMVPAEGGEAKQLTTLNASRDEVLHSDPLLLPGAQALVFSCLTSEAGTERIEALSLKDGKRSVVIERAVSPVWSSTGHLLFARDGAVFAVAIDPENLKTNGEALQIFAPGVVGTVRTGSIALELSSNGTLIFVPAKFAFKRLVAVDRDGSEKALNIPHGP
jgi:Tol biopolymer transport system component